MKCEFRDGSTACPDPWCSTHSRPASSCIRCTDEAQEKVERERDELRIVLGMLLNLFDPPSEAKRRRFDEDERGFWMAVSGGVNIGRQLIPKPPACRMCRGSGSDEYGAECSDCDGEGYDAKTPLTDAERRVWAAIQRNVAERAKEE